MEWMEEDELTNWKIGYHKNLSIQHVRFVEEENQVMIKIIRFVASIHH